MRGGVVQITCHPSFGAGRCRVRPNSRRNDQSSGRTPTPSPRFGLAARDFDHARGDCNRRLRTIIEQINTRWTTLFRSGFLFGKFNIELADSGLMGAGGIGSGQTPLNGKKTGTDSTWNDYVALTGLVLIGVLGLAIVWFYGTGGETSAAGVLGLAFTAIGSIVGAVFGIGAGTKSGAAAGQQVGAAKTGIAKKSLSGTDQALQQALSDLRTHRETLATHAQMVQPLIKTQVSDAVQKSLAGENLAGLQKQLEDAILKTETAIGLLSD